MNNNVNPEMINSVILKWLIYISPEMNNNVNPEMINSVILKWLIYISPEMNNSQSWND
jgi:hypothetical protein